jgi:hypothetical protein
VKNKYTQEQLNVIAAATSKLLGAKVLHGDWVNTGVDQVFKDFRIDPPENVVVLFACYTYQDYSGDAFVLFQKDGTLFEVHSSHCSCYGLEGQWSPEETSIDALKHQLDSASNGVLAHFKDEVTKVLNIIEGK